MIELKWHNVGPYNRVKEMLQKEDRVAYISCTGTGKTYVAAKYVEENGLEDKTLIVCPTNAIREEWKAVLPNVKVVTYAAIKNIDSATDYQLIITDELHHLLAEVWHKDFDRLVEGYKGKILGLTATNIRYLDGCKDVAKEYFNDCKVHGYDLGEAIDVGVLPTFTYVSALYDFKEYKKELLRKYNVSEKLKTRLDLYENEYEIERIIKKNVKGKKILVFTDGIDAMDDVISMIRKIYPKDVFYKVSIRERVSHNKKVIKEFKQANERAFLFSVNMLNEGVHVDGIDTVIMLRKTKSAIVYMQQLGRALATNNNKKKPVIIDLVANHHNLLTYTKLQSNTIEWLIRDIKDKKKQIIVEDYALNEIELIEHIKDLYGVTKRIWTLEEDEIIRANAKMTISEMQKKFFPYRSVNCVGIRRRKLCGSVCGLVKWTEKEIEVVKKNWKMTPTELHKLFPEKDIKNIIYILGRVRKKLGKNLGAKNKAEWSDDEIKIIEQNIEKSAVELCKYLPGKTSKQIRHKRRNMRLKKGLDKVTHKFLRWQKWEDDYIREHSDMTGEEMAKVLTDRTAINIRARRAKLGILKRRKWSEDEDKYILGNWGRPQKEVAKEMGVSVSQLSNRKGFIAQKFKREGKELPKNDMFWSPEEVRFINSCKSMTNEQLGKKFGVSKSAIEQLKIRIRRGIYDAV